MSQSSTMNTNKAATIAKVPVAFQREAAQALRHKVAVYVPATVNVTEAVDNTFFVGEAEATLCLAFGGATIMQGVGAWFDNGAGQVVRESVTVVYAFANENDFEMGCEQVHEVAACICKQMAQACVAVELDGVMYFVEA